MRKLTLSLCQNFKVYLWRPVSLFLAHWTVAVAVLIAVALSVASQELNSRVLNSTASVSIFLSRPGWIFEIIPQSLQRLTSDSLLALALIGIFGLQVGASMLVAQDVVNIYRGQRKSLLDSARGIEWHRLLWYACCSMAANVIYVVIISLVYAIAHLFWLWYRVDLSILWILAVAALFPWIYASLSVSAKLAALPGERREAERILLSMFRWGRAARAYSFFALRICAEMLVVIMSPIVIGALVTNRVVATLIVVPVVIVPLTVFRGSTLEWFLATFGEEPWIAERFGAVIQGDGVEVKSRDLTA